MRVLVCDDELLLAEGLRAVLVGRGDDVRVTTTPDQAVAQAAEWQPDLCVMDRLFPGGDQGVAAAALVLEVAPATRVLMLTGDPDVATARAAVAAGVRAFLRKDEALDVLLDALDQVAAGLLVVDPRVLRPGYATPPVQRHPLTLREQEVLQRLVVGETSAAIAVALGVSYSTVRTHVQNVLLKLGVHSQLEATAYAVRHGLVADRAAG